MFANLKRAAAGAACLGVAVFVTSCSPDAPTANRGPAIEASKASWGGTVSVCHLHGTRGVILEIAAPALGAHLAHGDYITTLLVSHGPNPAGDGVHFRRIADALQAARTGRLARGELVSAACRITIDVSDGVYTGTAISTATGDVEQFPFVVDVPDITLHGALRTRIDRDGRATDDRIGTAATTLTPLEPMPVVAGVSIPIIVDNAHPDGSAGNGLVVQGFVFQSGHDPAVDAGGQGVLALRTTGLTLEGNRFEAGFTESVDLRGVTGDVLRNYLFGTAGTCDVCMAGPGRYRAAGNRLLSGGIPGIIAAGPINLPTPAGIEPFVLPATAQTFARIVNNAISDHNRVPVGVGIRLDALGPNAPNVQSTLHAVIRDNLLVHNRFGVIIHAGFTAAGIALRGDIDARFRGNVFDQTCEAKLLVSLSRHTTALGLTNNPWLQNSTYRLRLNGNLRWSDAWYGNADGFGNTLIVDGHEIAHDIHAAYDPVGCPAA